MTKLFNQNDQKEKRQELRNRPTAAEVKLWGILRSNQLGVKFRRQYGIGRWIVDFCAPRIKLVIEVDGDSHFIADAQDRDRSRQVQIEKLGFKVVRFTDTDVFESLEGVFDEITRIVASMTIHLDSTATSFGTTPNPSLVRRGTGPSDSPPYQGELEGVPRERSSAIPSFL